MSTNASRVRGDQTWLRRSLLSLIASFAVFLSGWAQSAQLVTLGPAFCEGEQVAVFPNVDFLGEPYTWELQFDGLAPDTTGTEAALQPVYNISATNAGVYDFELTVIGADTTISSTWTVEIATGTAFGNLTLATLAPGLEEVAADDGITLFRSCSNTALTTMDFDVSFSGTSNSVTSWTIDWGDGMSSTQNDAVGSTISHDYEPGSWAITFDVQSSASGTSGIQCGQTTFFNVFVGTAPEVNLTVAAAELCLNNPVGEVLLGNESLTEVTWDIQFSDGSPAVNFTTDTAITSLLHTFSGSSCGEVIETPFGDLNDGFYVTALASNACGFTPFINAGFFEVSVPPVLAIAAEPASAVCPEEVVTLTNASTPPTLTTGNGCTNDYTFFWEVAPAVTVLSGDLGSNNGFPGQPELWISGDDQIEVTSDVAGAHEVALISYTNTGCGADTVTYTLTVSEPGVLTLDLPNQVVCSGTPVQDFTFDVSPDEYAITWTVLDADSNAVAPGDFEGIDIVAGTGVDMASPSDNWTLTNTTTSNYTVLVEATVPCAASDPLIHQIVVQPEPVIQVTPSAQTLCSGETTNINLSVNTSEDLNWTIATAGGILTSSATPGPGTSIQDTWSNAGTTNGVVTYTVDVVNPNCPSTPVDVVVTVLPGVVPEDDLNNEVLCSGDAVSEITFPEVEGATYTWTNSNEQVGLASSGTDTIPAWTAALNTTSMSFQSEVVVTGQVGSCPIVDIATYTIEVQPSPVIQVTPSAQTLCSGETTNISLSVNTGEDLNWTIATAGGNLTSSVTPGLGTSIQDTWSNAGTTNGVVTYTVDVVDPNCPSTPVDVVVTVLPGLPALTLPPDQILCSEETFTGVDLPEVEGAVWTWTNANSNNGLAATGQQDIEDWVAPENVSSDSLGGLVTIVGQVGNCPVENAGEFLAVVNPTPTITATPADPTICSGLSPDVQLSVNTGDTLFWEMEWGDDILGDLEEDGSEVLIDNQFFNVGLEADSVVIVVTLLATSPATCPFEDDTITVTVLPGLGPEDFGDLTLCPDSMIATLNFPEIVGVDWSWENDNPSVGLPAMGMDSISAWTVATNATDIANVANVSVSGMVPGCDAAVVGSYQITVFPAPVLVATPAQPELCSGVPADIDLDWNGPGTATWVATGVAGVTGEADGMGSSIEDVLTNVNTFVSTVTYTVTFPDAICPGEPQTLEVDVLPAIPELILADVPPLCPGEAFAETPAPAIQTVEWSWENSNSGIGLPSAGQGIVPGWNATNPSTEAIDAVITLIGQAGECEPEEAGSFNVSVFPTPQADVEISSDGNLSCLDSLAVISWDILTEDTDLTSFEGGSILTVDILDSVVVDSAATYIMTLLSIDGCEATQEIVVNPIDDIAITDMFAMDPLCFEEASGVIEVITDESGTVDYQWTGPSAATDSLATDLLAGEYFVIVTNEAGCQDSSSAILSDPVELAISSYSLPSECGEANGFIVADAAGGTGELTYEWLDSDSVLLEAGTLELSGIDGGVYTFQAVDANGCLSDTSVNLECIPLPEPIPTQFISPNGDGKNDRWTIDNIYYFPNAIIQVFNRWGVEVFKSEGEYLEDWEGTNQDGKSLPSATYFYVIDTKKKSQRPFNGYLELQTNQP